MRFWKTFALHSARIKEFVDKKLHKSQILFKYYERNSILLSLVYVCEHILSPPNFFLQNSLNTRWIQMQNLLVMLTLFFFLLEEVWNFDKPRRKKNKLIHKSLSCLRGKLNNTYPPIGHTRLDGGWVALTSSKHIGIVHVKKTVYAIFIYLFNT